MPETVTVLSSRVMQTLVAPGVFKAQVSITYAAENLMPRTVYIDQGKDTPEERRRVIAEDLKRARETRPETLELP